MRYDTKSPPPVVRGADDLRATAAQAPGEATASAPFAGSYRLEARIGRGGMSDVYAAEDLASGRRVAVKILSHHDRSSRMRFAREAEALMRMDHPAVVAIHDAGEDELGRPFLVMDLVEGANLAEHVERHGAMDAARAVRILRPILGALEQAHAAGIVHRDLKPENVMLEPTAEGLRARLLDFGIARLPERSARLTRGWLGTPAFMAPEQMSNAADVGPAVDQWAFAVTLYETISGTLPFGVEPERLLRAVREAPLPFPRDGSLDGRLFAVLARATRKRPEDRYPSVRELADELDAWLARLAPPAPNPTPVAASPEPAERPSGRPSLDAAIRNAFRS